MVQEKKFVTGEQLAPPFDNKIVVYDNHCNFEIAFSNLLDFDVTKTRFSVYVDVVEQHLDEILDGKACFTLDYENGRRTTPIVECGPCQFLDEPIMTIKLGGVNVEMFA